MDNTMCRSTCLGTWKLCYAHQNRLKARITLAKIKNASKVHTIFFTPFYFEIILDPHLSQNYNTERSYVSFTQLPTIKLVTIKLVTCIYIYTLWSRKWQPTPVFLPGKSHGRRSLGSYSPWVTKSWAQLSN